MCPVRPNDELRVSGEIEAFCTKCALLTNHRIVAFDGDKIKKVICLTCQSQHAYRLAAPKKKAVSDPAPPKDPKDPRETKEPKPRPARTSQAKTQAKKTSAEEPEANARQWQERRETTSHNSIVPYTLAGIFESGQALEHSRFGVGFVLKVIHPNKIEVLFENFTKTLIMKKA
ncbi:MAG: hypothetical protein LBK52_06920 [Deltaproteobacteria bacterium]|jgi:hypothetical protein|nr:hypothetical protein [Deltaproteobacteria bacterium]